MSTAPATMDEIDSAVRGLFTVEAQSLEGGLPAYIIQPSPDLEEKFRRLYLALRRSNLAPTLRAEGGRLVLRVATLPRRRRLRSRALATALLIATLGTIFVAGYVVTALDPVISTLDESVALNPTPHLLGYALSMIGIVGVHELGHKLACRAHGIK
ncbi:MAG: hypothetical protein N3H31_07355, partial [Candidatus Nezhaarchaeota archaeon]|nr:hypothetical protein [Candidatus Nezhaarchaeota archaeon]